MEKERVGLFFHLQVEWERGEGTPVGATTTSLDRDGYEFTFESRLTVDPSTCHGTETVKCTLALDNENQEVEATASICGQLRGGVIYNLLNSSSSCIQVTAVPYQHQLMLQLRIALS